MWLANFFPRRTTRRDALQQLAIKIAHDCQRSVWNRVCHRVLTMRLNEARGYVRARAANCIYSEVERIAERHPQLTQSHLDDLIARATDQVVGLVIRDVLVVPARTIYKRRAAAA